MSRKFTDSEVRAYSKNRFEEKKLKQRLEKLKEEFGVYHDSTAKHRCDLISECKDIRLTTGGSPRPRDLIPTEHVFDFSKRVKRPWIYSVMDTTYNAVYRESVIPLPKQRTRRSKSAATDKGEWGSHSSDDSLKPERRWSSTIRKSPISRSTPVVKGSNRDVSVETRADILLQPSMHTKSVSSPEIRLNNQRISDTRSSETLHEHVTLHDAWNDISNQSTEGQTCTEEIKYSKQENSPDYENSGTHLVEDMFEKSKAEPEEGETLFGIVIDRKPNTRVICLPPVYKIDSKAYQQAERERTASRAQSRVSFSSTSTNIVISENPKLKPGHNYLQNKPESTNTESTKQEKDTDIDKLHEKPHSADVKSGLAISIKNAETETDDVNLIQGHSDLSYKGRKLRNYIPPEERYKLDPVVMKRRQNRMDTLAKESMTFLKRVNHENIRVEIAFPRSARRRLMTKLVLENNSGKGRKRSNTDGPVIQTKVEKFMVAISDYVHRQQNDATKES